MAAEQLMGEIASEVSTGTSSADGTRVSKDSDWTKFTVPDGFIINKDRTSVGIISEQGSEHTYAVEYEDYVEIIPGTNILQPTSIKAKTHARSSTGPFGGGGSMKIKVTFYYVKYR